MIKVVLVEDQRLVRACIRGQLERSGIVEVVAEAESGEEARRLLRHVGTDVVLMDMTMPGMSGVETTRRLVAQHPKMRIVGLSQHVDGLYPASFLRAGGSGYVSKNAEIGEVLLALRRVSQGGRHLSADVARELVADPAGEVAAPKTPKLTRREQEILRLITEGCDLARIATVLALSPKTVAAHRRELLKRCEATNDVQLARVGRRLGLDDPTAH